MKKILNGFGLTILAVLATIMSVASSIYVYSISKLNIEEKTKYPDQEYQIPISEFVNSNTLFDIYSTFGWLIFLVISFFFFYQKKKIIAFVIILTPFIINIIPALLIHAEWQEGISLFTENNLNQLLN